MESIINIYKPQLKMIDEIVAGYRVLAFNKAMELARCARAYWAEVLERNKPKKRKWRVVLIRNV